MTFDAKVFRILVASPADVGEERSVIPEVINDWNAVSAARLRSVLMPVKWETHSAPLLGDRPQAIINDQIVKDCDLLVGVFWTRIGTHTGVSVSGTAEEIEQFVSQGKPVMLYFSQAPVDPERIDPDQFVAMRGFREKMRLKGLTESYSGMPDFRQKFGRQLSINLETLLGDSKMRTGRPPVVSSRRSSIKTPAELAMAAGKLERLSKEQIDEYLAKAVTGTARVDGWANIAAVGNYLRTYTPIDYRSYGYDSLRKLLESSKQFELKAERKSPKALGIDSVAVRLLNRV